MKIQWQLPIRKACLQTARKLFQFGKQSMHGTYHEMSLILSEIVEHQETRAHQSAVCEAANHSMAPDHPELVIIAADYTIRMNQIASLLSSEHLQEVIFHWKAILGGMQEELDSRDTVTSKKCRLVTHKARQAP